MVIQFFFEPGQTRRPVQYRKNLLPTAEVPTSVQLQLAPLPVRMMQAPRPARATTAPAPVPPAVLSRDCCGLQPARPLQGWAAVPLARRVQPLLAMRRRQEPPQQTERRQLTLAWQRVQRVQHLPCPPA